jgi:uncharacterized protein with GYD domain
MMQNPHDRAEATRPMVKAMGGRLIEYYFAVGENTTYVVTEIPDEMSVSALTMAILAGGALETTKCTPILTAAEAVEAMQKAADVAYQPPSA